MQGNFIECRYCGNVEQLVGFMEEEKICTACWKVKMAIESNIKVAEIILQDLKKKGRVKSENNI